VSPVRLDKPSVLKIGGFFFCALCKEAPGEASPDTVRHSAAIAPKKNHYLPIVSSALKRARRGSIIATR
jgi:hypothetical protein